MSGQELEGEQESMGEAFMTAAKGKRFSSSSRPEGAGDDTLLANALRSHFRLSRMEALVACALANGLTYQEIADRLQVSYHTVHSHVKAIHQKLGVHSNGRAAAIIRRLEYQK